MADEKKTYRQLLAEQQTAKPPPMPVVANKQEYRKLLQEQRNDPIHPSTHRPMRVLQPAPSPDLRHVEEKRYMLELINAERKRAGFPPVELGDNVAAQLHAEAALENGVSSHWGIDGLKPYMRYSLAGGYQSNGENGSGLRYRITSSDGYRALDSIESEIQKAIQGWMGSPGHKRNILDRWHKKVNIGLAWDQYNLMAYQHFEGDYIELDRLPDIENGVLTLSGQTMNGAQFPDESDLSVQVYYDPTPHRLTVGQISRTYCYDSGRLVAALRKPVGGWLMGGSHYSEHEFTRTYQPCPDPYAVSPDAPAPRSPSEAHDFWQQAYDASQVHQGITITVPWITASKWTARGDRFSLTADLKDVVKRHRNGVYTITLWANIGGERLVVSEYSIFHGVKPPGTYSINP